MRARPNYAKLLIGVLALTVAVWAQAGLALTASAPAMQCSMTMQGMSAADDMGCCPGESMSAPSGAVIQCCSMEGAPERPVSFELTSKQISTKVLQVVATVRSQSAMPVPPTIELGWNSGPSPYVKPVLELKTDLRI